jgi:hypothetical protein
MFLTFSATPSAPKRSLMIVTESAPARQTSLMFCFGSATDDDDPVQGKVRRAP